MRVLLVRGHAARRAGTARCPRGQSVAEMAGRIVTRRTLAYQTPSPGLGRIWVAPRLSRRGWHLFSGRPVSPGSARDTYFGGSVVLEAPSGRERSENEEERDSHPTNPRPPAGPGADSRGAREGDR